MLSRIVTTPQSLLRQPGKSKGDMCLWLESMDSHQNTIDAYDAKEIPI